MFILEIFLLISPFLMISWCEKNVETTTNLTGPKDMYVVRATVYQVGILTNKTNNTAESNIGHQEALTIYHNNGSGIDLSAIPSPLQTNVTAEKVVGLAPVTNESTPWMTLQRLISTPQLQVSVSSGRWFIVVKEEKIYNLGNSNDPYGNIHSEKSKRDVSKTPVEIIKGAAVIPSEAEVNSIALPPLLTLNNNLSSIPVPVPNLSVVSYAKINTLVHSP